MGWPRCHVGWYKHHVGWFIGHVGRRVIYMPYYILILGGLTAIYRVSRLKEATYTGLEVMQGDLEAM